MNVNKLMPFKQQLKISCHRKYLIADDDKFCHSIKGYELFKMISRRDVQQLIAINWSEEKTTNESSQKSTFPMNNCNYCNEWENKNSTEKSIQISFPCSKP